MEVCVTYISTLLILIGMAQTSSCQEAAVGIL